MNYETLKIKKQDGILEIIVNRPGKLNALNEMVLNELKDVLTSVQKDGFETRGIILTGEGERSFIAGADIKAMCEMTPDQAEAFGKLGQDVSRLFETVPVPVIACVNGFALGGGCEMAMSSDFIYATTNSLFGQPEINLALIPGFGGTQRLRRFVGLAKSRELIYTGRNVKIDEAERIGLVSRVFESKEEMLNAARETLGMISSKSPLIVSKCKEVINEGECHGIDKGLEIERAGFKSIFFDERYQRGLNSFLGKKNSRI